MPVAAVVWTCLHPATLTRAIVGLAAHRQEATSTVSSSIM